MLVCGKIDEWGCVLGEAAVDVVVNVGDYGPRIHGYGRRLVVCNARESGHGESE